MNAHGQAVVTVRPYVLHASQTGVRSVGQNSDFHLPESFKKLEFFSKLESGTKRFHSNSIF